MWFDYVFFFHFLMNSIAGNFKLFLAISSRMKVSVDAAGKMRHFMRMIDSWRSWKQRSRLHDFFCIPIPPAYRMLCRYISILWVSLTSVPCSFELIWLSAVVRMKMSVAAAHGSIYFRRAFYNRKLRTLFCWVFGFFLWCAWRAL